MTEARIFTYTGDSEKETFYFMPLNEGWSQFSLEGCSFHKDANGKYKALDIPIPIRKKSLTSFK